MEPPSAAAGEPCPGEPLWSLRKDHVTWSAELRYHGEYGVEAQILRNDELRIGRRFDLRELAVRWADQKREHIRARFRRRGITTSAQQLRSRVSLPTYTRRMALLRFKLPLVPIRTVSLSWARSREAGYYEGQASIALGNGDRAGYDRFKALAQDARSPRAAPVVAIADGLSSGPTTE